MYYIGVDLGGTNIATAVINEKFEIIGKGGVSTNCPRPAEEIAKDIAKSIELAVEDAGVSMDEINSVGIGSPGAVNAEEGVIEFAGNLGFDNVPLAKLVEKYCGKKCFVENDANAAAYGEYIAGAGRGSKNFIAVTLGTGVGGGIIIDGKIFSGWNSFGAELGHTTLIMNGEPCTCGRNGCFEAYASATALIRQTKAAMEKDKASKMWEIAGSLDNVNGKTAFDGMRAGDETAKKVCDQYIEYVACGIVDIINTFQPEFVCIGGGISKEKDNLRIPIEQYVDKYRFGKTAKKKTAIKIAQLGNDAGIIGAAFLGLK